MTQWHKLLKSLGFSESEATIYLTSLEMGAASVQDLAKKAKVSRVTTYAVIETMMKSGLMSTVQKGKKTMYVAESPDRLTSFVHMKMRQMETTLKEVETAIQDLKLLQRGEKPVVKMFEGREALKAIQDDILRTQPKELDEFGNIDEILAIYPSEEMRPFYDQVSKFTPKIRSLLLGKKNTPRKAGSHVDMITLPHEDFSFTGDILIYGKKIAFSTFKDKQISVLVESDELAKTMRSLFDYIWKQEGGKK